MWSAPSNRKFYAFAVQFTKDVFTNNLHIIPNDEEEEIAVAQPSARTIATEEAVTASETQRESSESQREPVLIDFADELEGEEPDQEPLDITRMQAALRKCHCRMNHMPFSRIQAMARHGLLPRYLAKVDPPFCASCAYGKATRRPWRTKGKQHSLVPVTASGQCMSVDQLESPTPGFIGQIKGILTTKRY